MRTYHSLSQLDHQEIDIRLHCIHNAYLLGSKVGKKRRVLKALAHYSRNPNERIAVIARPADEPIPNSLSYSSKDVGARSHFPS